VFHTILEEAEFDSALFGSASGLWRWVANSLSGIAPGFGGRKSSLFQEREQDNRKICKKLLTIRII
jgi:hypothetical protein